VPSTNGAWPISKGGKFERLTGMKYTLSFTEEATAALAPIMSIVDAERIVRREVGNVLYGFDKLPSWGFHCVDVTPEVELIAWFHGDNDHCEVDLVARREPTGPFESLNDMMGTEGRASIPIPASAKKKKK